MAKLNLDYYMGRPVERVDVHKKQDWHWGIRLVGDVIIRNKDKRRTAVPQNLVGTVFMRAIFSELDTRLQFGSANEEGMNVVEEVVLTPAQYSISDPTVEEEVYPQVPDEEEQIVIPEHPDERVAEGPSQEWKDKQKPKSAATEEEVEIAE